MSIEEDVASLNLVKAKLEEAWNTASSAKEQFAEARDLLMGVVGPISNMPALAGQADTQMEEGGSLCENAQEKSTEASQSIDSYITQISS